MNEPQEEIIIRPLDIPADLSRLLDLFQALERERGATVLTDEAALSRALAWPNHERWVAVAGPDAGSLLGYGVAFHQTTERSYAGVYIRPGRAGDDVKAQLLNRLAETTAARGARYLTVDVPVADRTAADFLASQGFGYRGDAWALVAPAGAVFPPPVWPDGYTVKTYEEVNDLQLFTALCILTFSDLWGHWENTPGTVNEASMAETLRSFDPRGVFLVFGPNGDAVAQCRTQASTEEGAPHLLDQPGVAPPERANGLHAPLALTAARWLRQQGDRPVRLESWGDAPETIALYESLGFVPAEHEVSYVRDLSA